MSATQEPFNYTYLIIAGYIAALVAVILYLKLHNRGKMRVFVKNPLGDNLFWKKPGVDEKGNFIVMQKADKHKLGWSFHFDSSHLQNGKGRFGGKYQYIEIFPNAPEPIAFNYATKQTEESHFTKAESEKLINKKLLERRGEEPKESSGNMGLILLGILMIANIVITVFLSGRITFH